MTYQPLRNPFFLFGFMLIVFGGIAITSLSRVLDIPVVPYVVGFIFIGTGAACIFYGQHRRKLAIRQQQQAMQTVPYSSAGTHTSTLQFGNENFAPTTTGYPVNMQTQNLPGGSNVQYGNSNYAYPTSAYIPSNGQTTNVYPPPYPAFVGNQAPPPYKETTGVSGGWQQPGAQGSNQNNMPNDGNTSGLPPPPSYSEATR